MYKTIARLQHSLKRINARQKILVGVVVLLVLWICGNCKDEITGGTIVFPDSGVSYGKQVEPLFLENCAFSGCHGEDTYSERGYSLEAYQHATARAGIIVPCIPNQPCDPENSILVRRIEGLDGLPQMPISRPALNSNQINGIKTWIREGAQNN